MGKIFGIEDLPVAQPFPSLSFGKDNFPKRPLGEYIEQTISKDTFVKKATKEGYFKKFFKAIRRGI